MKHYLNLTGNIVNTIVFDRICENNFRLLLHLFYNKKSENKRTGGAREPFLSPSISLAKISHQTNGERRWSNQK